MSAIIDLLPVIFCGLTDKESPVNAEGHTHWDAVTYVVRA
jgi:hypothetical protein